ncbi:MAG: hypothetical protein WC456_02505 [Patescibacteria group bacterium]
MGLDILPKGGIGFKASSGTGNFKAKLDKLTRNQGGEFGMLRNNRQAINAAIAKKASAIKLKGGLNRMERKSVLAEIMRNDKTITKQDKYKVKELLEHYARDQKAAAEKTLKKPAVNMALDDAEAPPKRPSFAHVSNPDFFKGASADNQGLGRGLAARSAINYNRMKNLGSGEAARKLQEDAFAKLQQSAGGAGRPGLARGSSLGPLKLLK